MLRRSQARLQSKDHQQTYAHQSGGRNRAFSAVLASASSTLRRQLQVCRCLGAFVSPCQGCSDQVGFRKGQRAAVLLRVGAYGRLLSFLQGDQACWLLVLVAGKHHTANADFPRARLTSTALATLKVCNC